MLLWRESGFWKPLPRKFEENVVAEKVLVTLAGSWDDSRSAGCALGQSAPNCRGVRIFLMLRPLLLMAQKPIFDALSAQQTPFKHELKTASYDTRPLLFTLVLRFTSYH